MSDDSFIDKAGDAARKLFGSDGNEQRYKDGGYAGSTPRNAQPYPMGDVADTAPGSHYGAASETRIGGSAGTNDRGNHADDAHYREARERHMATFDRDYDDYRREHGSGEFASWHATRQRERFSDTHSGTSEASSRALNEREGQGSDGPHILDRSFSGTYDKD